jgi:hypothetical protein
MRFPFACSGKVICAMPVMRRGYKIPVMSVSRRKIMSAGFSWFRIIDETDRVSIQ